MGKCRVVCASGVDGIGAAVARGNAGVRQPLWLNVASGCVSVIHLAFVLRKLVRVRRRLHP